MVERFPVQLSRHAFSPHDIARGGDLWRLCQDIAVIGSSRRGWPPERYREEQCAFVVRSMTALHHRDTAFGEALTASTWVSSFKRGTLSDRQIRVHDEQGQLVLSATQRWVHVVLPELKPGRAKPALEQSFGMYSPTDDGDIKLPGIEPAEGPEHTFSFETWYTWMDPLAHANHPLYVDWADEATSRMTRAAGLDPHALRPLGGEVIWRSGVLAPERVTVQTRLAGTALDGVALEHKLLGEDGRICAEAVLLRGLADVPRQRWVEALQGRASTS
jgi:acyl-CoA thioesterase FadM